MTKAAPTIIITGADGFLGTALVSHFVAKGWQVRALVIKPPRAKQAGVEFMAYDLAAALSGHVFEGADYLVHTAYLKQDRQHPDAFNLNITAAKRLMAGATAAVLKKCLFMSSMSAHEDAVSAYGRQKLAIEKFFSGKNGLAIRSGLIIGNGGIVRQMVDFMRSKHVVPLVGGGKQPVQIIARDDLVTVIDKLLGSRLSGVLTVATPQVYTYKQLYRAISQHFSIRVLFVPVPFFLLLNGLRLVSLLPVRTAVNADNALGLKKLQAVNTAPELKKIGVSLMPLEAALDRIRP